MMYWNVSYINKCDDIHNECFVLVFANGSNEM